MLTHFHHADDSSSSPGADGVVNRARQRGLTRMLQALFREELLQASHLITEGTISWLPLWPQQGLLRFERLSIGRIGDCRLDGEISYIQSGGPSRSVAPRAGGGRPV
jgi:hypothetical protein